MPPRSQTAASRTLAFVLHVWPYSESSLIAELFTRDQGRVVALAKGARRPRSGVRPLLQPFAPVTCKLVGKSEVQVLSAVEWAGSMGVLEGERLLSGMYINELLLGLLPRHDPHPDVFDHYVDALAGLAAPGASDATIRRFEYRLMRDLGYMPVPDASALANAAPDAPWSLNEHEGWHMLRAGPGELHTSDFDALQADDFADPARNRRLQAVLRRVIEHARAGCGARSRQAWQEFSRLRAKATPVPLGERGAA
ncbi:MAG TPA: DNA repair protein RecO [Burkholderiaceae bacterium]|nr:DNA repair protein RecO [Burkholderiaceae bacterium]